MNVDGVLPVLVAEFLGENLHVPGQHNKIYQLPLQDIFNLMVDDT